MREDYGIPQNKRVFVYGGNLGRPQDVPFIVECLRECAFMDDVHFVIAGSGTDRHVLEEYIQTDKPMHVTLLEQLPRDQYDRMIGCCDVGLIFLDHRFTIPNFPSRLLSYMQAGLPVLACTDPCTDIGQVVVDGGFGWWCESNDVSKVASRVSSIDDNSYQQKKDKIVGYLYTHYSSAVAYNAIINNN